MGRTARTEPQCLYKGALYLLPIPSFTESLDNGHYILPSYLLPVRCLAIIAIDKHFINLHDGNLYSA
jgi:hypothetical protein